MSTHPRATGVWAALLLGSALIGFPRPVHSFDDGAWSRIDVQLPPESGTAVSAIFDAPRDRMLVYGGQPEVHSLQLTDFAAWSTLPATNAPPRRFAHSAIVHAASDQMIVFGGVLNSVFLNDVWKFALDGSGWNQVVPGGSPPAERASHSAIHDPVRNRMIVFGGSGAEVFGDLWALSLSGTPIWTPLVALGSGPSPRSRHTAVYDPVRDRMLIFGGLKSGLQFTKEVWELSLSGTPAWTQIAVTGTSRPIWGHTAVYDPIGDRMVVFGGMVINAPNWVSTGAVSALALGSNQWETWAPFGEAPFARASHSAIFDTGRRDMVVFGGTYTGPMQVSHPLTEVFRDIHVLDLSSTVAVDPPVESSALTGIRVAPNPGRGVQSIEFVLAPGARATVDVIDLAGRKVWSSAPVVGTQPHRVKWDGRDAQGAVVRPGIYFARLAGSRAATRFIRLN